MAMEFADFVHARTSALVRTAFLMTGDRGHAEDLVQTSLLAAHRTWSSIDEPEAYVRAVLMRRFLSWRRRLWHGEIPTAELPDHGSPDADVEDRLALWQQVLELPVRQRAVIVLAYYEDRSEADIAQALGCSTGAVKSHRARALRRLREQIDMPPPLHPGMEPSHDH